MKTIEIDDELYHFIAGHTQYIGEDASSILRRMLKLPQQANSKLLAASEAHNEDALFSIINDLIYSKAFIEEKKSVNRFVQLLAALYHTNKSRFAIAAASLHGSKRRYLATNKQDLQQTGRNTKPKAIPDTAYWVVTNNNSARKCHILQTMMQHMQLPNNLIDAVLQQFTIKTE